MKKLLLLSTFAFGLFTFSLAQQYGWTDISANVPGTPDLSDVFFVSDDEGWITSSSIAEIYHTTDGGQTFEVQTTLYTCNAIHMLNANVGYAGGASGFIYKTTDGGEHWDFHGTMSTTLADISFPPAGDTGYCCGLNGNIWMIHSTGVTKMTSNINGHLYAISFPENSEEGWVCGGSVIRHYKNNIWNADQDMPPGGFNAIYMIDTLNGWIVGDKGIIAHTTDGHNWFEQTNPDPENRTLYDVYFLNKNEGWAVGIGGQILHTTNGGENWDISTEGTFQLNAIHFTSPTNGFVVGNGKTLLKYSEVSGIEDFNETIEFEIFPNPCRDGIIQIAVYNIQYTNYCLEVLDLSGRAVVNPIEEWAEEHSIRLDINHLSSGIYFIRVNLENQTIVKKIIKQ